MPATRRVREEEIEMERMKRASLPAIAKPGFGLVAIVVLAVTLALVWAPVAEAQVTPPADQQYGNPATPVGSEVNMSGGGATETASGSGSAQGVVGVLPETGGPAILLLGLGGGAVVGAGLMIMRRSARGR